MATTVDLMRVTAENHADREAFVDGDRRMTFGEWDRAADGVASWMQTFGVEKGEVVCLRLPSSIDYAVCYQAAMRLGAITSGINTRLGAAEVDSIVFRTDPRLVISEEDLEEVRGAFAEGPPRMLPKLSPSDVVAIVWTSGTTGAPKGAMFDHDNLAAVSRGAGPLSQTFDRRLSPLPFPHVAYMTRAWDELEHVITTVITPTPWKAADALRLIEAERVTVAQGVPTQWSLMLAHRDFDSTDFSSLRLASTGASTVAPELVREMRRRLGCDVVVRYTSTEASLSTGTALGDPDEAVARTVGAAVEGVDLMLVEEDGAEVPTGKVGTVRCRSGAVMRGYWKDPERTAVVLAPDGWLSTGDLGFLDERGYLTLVGRHSEMFIRGGYNVYPAEVENVLTEHAGVDRAAVVGVPDRVLGEIGVAFIVPIEGAVLDVDELRAWCRSRLADYKAPDRVEIVADLPLTAMLKVDKNALRSRLS